MKIFNMFKKHFKNFGNCITKKKLPRKRKLALSIIQQNGELAEAVGVFPCFYDKSKNKSSTQILS